MSTLYSNLSKIIHGKQITIRTKSIYKPKHPEDGTRILVTRFYPRGVKKDHFDTWARELAPSAKLLADYKKQKLTWQEFERLLRQELFNNPQSMQFIEDLKSSFVIESKVVTLLCYEPQGVPCHRHLLKAIINNPGLLLTSFKSEYADN